MTIAHRKRSAVCSAGVSPAEWSLSAGPVLWHDNDSPNATSLRSGEGASRLITMTMGTLRAGPALDTAYEMTGMTLSSQMEGFDFLKRRQMDGVTAALSKLLGGPSAHFPSQAESTLGGRAFCPNALPREPPPLSLCLTVCLFMK